MASRSTVQVAIRLARSAHVRRLSMTGPARYPSQLLTQSKASLTGDTDSQGAGIDGATAAHRQFNSSRSLRSVKDSSTIDFAYLPDLRAAELASANEQQFSVPLLLSTMYSGSMARAIQAAEPEIAVEPRINLLAASGTHISMPSIMSDVHDNNAVEFEGIAVAPQADGAAAATPPQVSDFRRLLNGVLDDLLGPRSPAQQK